MKKKLLLPEISGMALTVPDEISALASCVGAAATGQKMKIRTYSKEV